MLKTGILGRLKTIVGVFRRPQSIITKSTIKITPTTTGLRLGNMELKQMPNSSNKVNTTKVFDSGKIGNAQLQKEVFAYAEKLGGGKLTERSPGQVWAIKTAEGATINVRSVSSTPLPDGTKPRWTIEIIKDKRLNSMINDNASMRNQNQNREIKFK